MRAFLEKNINKDYLDDFVYASKEALLNRGIEVVDFDGTRLANLEAKNPKDEDIIIGSVQACEKFFELVGMPVPQYVGYPEQLMNFYGRSIWTCRFSDVKPDMLPVFMKPQHGVKLFTGMVVDKPASLEFVGKYYPEITPDTCLYCSEVVQIESEYRCFVLKGELKGIQWYAGDFRKFPDVAFIDAAVAAYTNCPIAYTLDVAVCADGMKVIEVNDMWAIGSYGFNAKDYVQMTIERFNELKKAHRNGQHD